MPSLLDAFLPEPRLLERDHVDVAAPLARAWEVTRGLDAGRIPIARALFSLRTLPERLLGDGDVPAPTLTIDAIGAEGSDFQILAEAPPRGIVVGAIGRFWESDIPFVHVPADVFASYDALGLGKVAWSLELEALSPTVTRIVLEVRVTATDEPAWQAFRRYFALIGPFSRWIRVEVLRLLEAELGGLLARDETRSLAGDDYIPSPASQITEAITIDAPPGRVWPWLVQMGGDRAGWYSLDALDHDGRESLRVIEPSLQELRVGQSIAVLPDPTQGAYTVLALEPERALVLGGTTDLATGTAVPPDAPLPPAYWRASWAFVLEPLGDGQTRLVTRARVGFESARGALRASLARPIHHVMERAQLRNLKARVEGTLPGRTTAAEAVDGVLGALEMAACFATPFLRDGRSHWGLTEAEAEAPHPGDDVVSAPRWGWTHGVEIDRAPREVWPWVAQLGQDRAGFYSYTALENLAGCRISTADATHEGWALRVGDPFFLHPKIPPLRVIDVVPGRQLLIEGQGDGRTLPHVSWLFLLEPRGESRCRVISRYRVAYEDALAMRLSAGPLFLEPIGATMDRRMLRGLRALVEGDDPGSVARSPRI